MRVLVVPVIIAVVVSLAVLATAAFVSPDGQGVRGFFQDLRAGIADRFGANRGRARLDVEPVDTSLDDFFAATTTQQDAYVAADGLANRIEHVVDGVTSRSRR